MPYKVLHIKEQDYKTFKQLKHRLQIDSDVKTFTRILEMATKDLNGINDQSEQTSDGVTG